MSKIAEAIAALEEAADSIPGVGKDDLESRLSDLESEAHELALRAERLTTDTTLDSLESAATDLSRDIEALADDLNTLYNEV